MLELHISVPVDPVPQSRPWVPFPFPVDPVPSHAQECRSQFQCIQFSSHGKECHSVNCPRGQESIFSFNGGQIPNLDSCTLVVVYSVRECSRSCTLVIVSSTLVVLVCSAMAPLISTKVPLRCEDMPFGRAEYCHSLSHQPSHKLSHQPRTTFPSRPSDLHLHPVPNQHTCYWSPHSPMLYRLSPVTSQLFGLVAVSLVFQPCVCSLSILPTCQLKDTLCMDGEVWYLLEFWWTSTCLLI